MIDEVDRLKAELKVSVDRFIDLQLENERLREALRIARVMVHDEPIAYAQYSNGRTLIQVLDLALNDKMGTGNDA